MKKHQHKTMHRGPLLLLALLMVATGLLAIVPPKDNKPRPKGGEIIVRHADQISYDEFRMPGVQIFKGNVEFFHDGVVLKCDSANFFQDNNSFAAFDNVSMHQADTLSLKCRYLFYDGNSQVAQARYDVVLKHRNSTLYTDSLDYDRLYSMGYFFEGGRLIDGNNTLTSDWGQYDAQTRMAEFNYNVLLQSPNYQMHTDTLYYNVLTKDANSRGRSNVKHSTANIYTENGYFNTSQNRAILLNRSIVEDRGNKLVADSIVYDRDNHIAEGFGDFVYNNEQNKLILTGDYCHYNDSTGYSIAHGRALVKSFSEPDTLYMHADTLKLYSYNLQTDSAYRVIHGYYHTRTFRQDVQATSDTLSFNSKERRLSLYGNPIVWNMRNQILGEEIHTYFNDSTIDSIHVVNQALMCEKLDSINYNQIASKEMRMYFQEGELRHCHAIQNVKINYFQLEDNVADTIVIAMNHAETSLMKLRLQDRKVHSVWTAETEGMFYPILFVDNQLRYLENFGWFDYMRPKSPQDVFQWYTKPEDKILKPTKRKEVPFQKLPR